MTSSSHLLGADLEELSSLSYYSQQDSFYDAEHLGVISCMDKEGLRHYLPMRMPRLLTFFVLCNITCSWSFFVPSSEAIRQPKSEAQQVYGVLVGCGLVCAVLLSEPLQQPLLSKNQIDLLASRPFFSLDQVTKSF